MTKADIPEHEDESIEVIYEEIRKALDLQKETLDSLEQKAATLMGFSGAILALLFSNIRDESLYYPARISVIVAVALALLSILMGGIVYWSKSIRVDPSPKALLEEFHTQGRYQTQLQVAVNRVDAFAENQTQLKRTALVLRIGMLTQIASIASLGIAIATLLVKPSQ